MAIDQLVNKALNQVEFKGCNSVNGSGSVVGSYAKSNLICHKCGRNGYFQKNLRSKGNCYKVNSIQNPTEKIP